MSDEIKKECDGNCAGCGQNSTCEEAKKDQENAVENEFKGLDYMIKLSYACVDRCEEMDYGKKRNLLFSLYSFRCLFDNAPLYSLSKVLVKYGCSFFTADEKYAKREHVYAVTDSTGKVAYKFDAGSPVWAEAVKAKKITGENATLPQKFTLFETAYLLADMSTATAELKALWLVYFPYVFLIGAPVEYDLYDALKEKLHTTEVFSCANEGRYADNICCTTAELNGEHPLIADWYRPFVEWKCEKNEKGISHETAKYQKALALGDYAYALSGTEKLLDSFPDDEEILLLNISARMSLAPSVGLEERVKLLSDNFRIITDAFKTPLKKYHYFLYYRGLTQLGMNMPDHAEADFKACLEIDERFEPALMMLKGIENAKNENNDDNLN